MLAKLLVKMKMGVTSAGLTVSLPLSEVIGVYKMPQGETSYIPSNQGNPLVM
jgi:hypothetical protein